MPCELVAAQRFGVAWPETPTLRILAETRRDYAQYPGATPVQLPLYYLRFFGGQQRQAGPFEYF
jgi:hypothetical protein